jgi:hypothetical protein
VPPAAPDYFFAAFFSAFFAFTLRFQLWRRFMMSRMCLLFERAIDPP